MEQQSEFGFAKELELKASKPPEEMEKESNIVEETVELPLGSSSNQTSEIKHYPAPCQHCEDADPKCRYCGGRGYDRPL